GDAPQTALRLSLPEQPIPFFRLPPGLIEPGFDHRPDVGIDPLDVTDIPFDGLGGRDLPRPDFFGQGGGVHVKKFPHRLTTNRILDQFPHESRESSRSIPFKRRKIPTGYHTWLTSGKTPSAK